MTAIEPTGDCKGRICGGDPCECDPSTIEAIEWATGQNGETVLAHLRASGFDVVRIEATR